MRETAWLYGDLDIVENQPVCWTGVVLEADGGSQDGSALALLETGPYTPLVTEMPASRLRPGERRYLRPGARFLMALRRWDGEPYMLVRFARGWGAPGVGEESNEEAVRRMLVR